MMSGKDPLERAFELLQADSAELAYNPDLENRLMNELHRRQQPRRYRKIALVAAAFLGLVLAGGGIAMAAGYNPLKLLVFIHSDGTAHILDENGQVTDGKLEVVRIQNGEIEARMEVPGNLPPGQTVELQLVAPAPAKK